MSLPVVCYETRKDCAQVPGFVYGNEGWMDAIKLARICPSSAFQMLFTALDKMLLTKFQS